MRRRTAGKAVSRGHIISTKMPRPTLHLAGQLAAPPISKLVIQRVIHVPQRVAFGIWLVRGLLARMAR